MSERIEGTASQAVARGCGFTALCIGSVMHGASLVPILALRIGGLLSLLVCFVLLLQATRAETTCFRKTRLWRQLEGHERPSADRAQAVIAGARRRAFQRHALPFAAAAAVLLAIALAGEVNLWLYPPV
jgi:hypothetical protein